MKSIFFLLIFINFLNADSFYNKQCVIEYAVLPIDNKIAIKYGNASNWSFYDYDENILNTLVRNDGYFLFQSDRSNINCFSSLSPTKFGLTNSQYNFMMAFLGGLYGLIVLFLLGAVL